MDRSCKSCFSRRSLPTRLLIRRLPKPCIRSCMHMMVRLSAIAASVFLLGHVLALRG